MIAIRKVFQLLGEINLLLARTRFRLAGTRLYRRDFTLISQNCLGGVLYHLLGMRFLSLTINMFIEDENFVKFVEKIDYYIQLDAKPMCECYIDPIDPTIRYPKISVGDIELSCLHYETCQDAVERWNERRKRVNTENLFVIANSWNLHNNKELAKRIVECPYKTILFSLEDWSDLPNCVSLKGNYWETDSRGVVRPNLTDLKPKGCHYYFEEQFDFIKWLNEGMRGR